MDFWKDIWHALNTPLSATILGGVVLLIATTLKITPLGLFLILLLWIFFIVELYCPQVRNTRSKLFVNFTMLVLLIVVGILLIVTGHAVNPDEPAATPASIEASSPTSSMQSAETETESNKTAASRKTVNETKEQKFRVEPTFRLRPMNSEINKSADGIVEFILNNPVLNDVTLEADTDIYVPSDIYIYPEYGCMGGGAGTATGHFSVPPGVSRTITIHIKGDKIGTFPVNLSILYWPGNDKANWTQENFNSSVEVIETIQTTMPTPAPTSDPRPTSGLGVVSLVPLLMTVFILRKN